MITDSQTDSVGLYFVSVLFVLYLWNGVLTYIDTMFSNVTTATVFARRLREEKSLERQDSKGGSVFPPRKRDPNLEAAFDKRKTAVRKAMDYLTEKERDETGGEWDLTRRKLEADRARQYLADKEWEKEQEVLATEREIEKEMLYHKQRLENEKLEKEKAVAAKRERQRQQELELQKQREYLMHARNYDDTGLLWPPKMPMKMRDPSGSTSREDSIEYYSSDDSDDEGKSKKAQSTSSPEEEPVIMGHLARAMMRAEERTAERLTSRPEGTRPWKSPETTAEIHHYGVRTLPIASTHRMLSPQDQSSDLPTSPEGPSGDELSSNDEGRKVKFGKKSNGQGIKSSKKTSSGSESSVSEGILKNNGKSDSPDGAHGGARPKTKLSGDNVDQQYKKKQAQNSRGHKLSPRPKQKEQPSPDFRTEKKTDKHFGFTLGQSDIERGYLHHMGLDVLAVDPDDTMWKEKIERHEKNLAAQKYQTTEGRQLGRDHSLDTYTSIPGEEGTIKPEASPTSPRNIIEMPGNLDGQLEELTKQFRAGRQKVSEKQNEQSELKEDTNSTNDDLSIVEEDEEERSLSRDSSFKRKQELKSPKTTKEGPILVPPSVMKEAIKSHGTIGVMSTRVGIPEADAGKAEEGTVLLKHPDDVSSSCLERRSSTKSNSSRRHYVDYERGSTSRRPSNSGELERRGSTKSKERSPSQPHDTERHERDRGKSNLTREHSGSLKIRKEEQHHSSQRRKSDGGAAYHRETRHRTHSHSDSQGSLRSRRPNIPSELKSGGKTSSAVEVSPRRLETDKNLYTIQKSPATIRSAADIMKSIESKQERSPRPPKSPRSPKSPKSTKSSRDRERGSTKTSTEASTNLKSSGRERERGSVKTSTEASTKLTPPTAPVRRNRSTSRQRKLERTPELEETDVSPKEGEMKRSPSIIRNSKKTHEQSQLAENDMNRSVGKEVKWAKEIERGREETRLEAPERPRRRRDESRSVERGEVRSNVDRGRDTKRDSLIGTSKSDGNIKSLMKTEPIREGIMSEQNLSLPKRPARRSRSRGTSSEAQQRTPLPAEGDKGKESQRSPNKNKIHETNRASTSSANVVPLSPSKEDLLKKPSSPKEVQLFSERLESPRSPRKEGAVERKDEFQSPKTKDRENEQEMPRSSRLEEEKDPDVDRGPGSDRSEDPLESPKTESSDSRNTWNIPTRPERKHRKSERKMKKSESIEDKGTEKSLPKETDNKIKRTHSFESVELKITLDDDSYDDKQNEEKENIPENRIPSLPKSDKTPESPSPEDKLSPTTAEVSTIGATDDSIQVSEKPVSNELPAETEIENETDQDPIIPQNNVPMTLPVQHNEQSHNIPAISSPDTGPSSIEPDFPERPPRKTKMKKRKVLAEKPNLRVQTKVENIEQRASNMNTDQKMSPTPGHDSLKPEHDSVKAASLNTAQKTPQKAKYDSLKSEHDNVRASTDQKSLPQSKHLPKTGSEHVKGDIKLGSTSPQLLTPVSPPRRVRSPLSQIRSRSLDHSTSTPSTSREKSLFAKHRTNMKEISNIIEEITQKTVSMMRHPGFTSCAALKRELSDEYEKSKSKDHKKSPMIRQRRSRSQDRFCSSTPTEPEFLVEKKKTSSLTRKSKAKRDKSAPAALSAPSKSPVVPAEKSVEASEPAPEAKPRRKHAAKLAKLHIPKTEDVPAIESPEVFMKKPVAEIMMDIEKSPIFHTQIVHPTKISGPLVPERQVQEKDAPKTPVRSDSLPTYSPETIQMPQALQEQVDVEAVVDTISSKADVQTISDVSVGSNQPTENKNQRFTVVKPGTGIDRLAGPRYSPRPELPKCIVDTAQPIRSSTQVKDNTQTTSTLTQMKEEFHTASVTPVKVESQIVSIVSQSHGEIQMAATMSPFTTEPLTATSISQVNVEPQLTTGVTSVLEGPQASVLSITDGPQVETKAEISSIVGDSIIPHGDSLIASVGSPTFFPPADPLRSPGGTKPPHKPPYTLWGEDGWVRTSPDRMEHHPHFPNHTPPVGDMWDSRRGSMKSDSTPETDRRSIVKKPDLRSESESEAKSESDLERVLESDVESKEDLSPSPKPEIERDVETDNVTAESLAVPSGLENEKTKESLGDMEKENILHNKELPTVLTADSSEIMVGMEMTSGCINESAIESESSESKPLSREGAIEQRTSDLTNQLYESLQGSETVELSDKDIPQTEQSVEDYTSSVQQQTIQATPKHDNDQDEVEPNDSEPKEIFEPVHADTKERAIECDLIPDTKDEITECDLSEPESPPTSAAIVLSKQPNAESIAEFAQAESEIRDLLREGKEEVQDKIQAEIEPLSPDQIDNEHVENVESHALENIADVHDVTHLESQMATEFSVTDAEVKHSDRAEDEVEDVPSDQFGPERIPIPDVASQAPGQMPADVHSKEVEVSEEMVIKSDISHQIQATLPPEPIEGHVEVHEGVRLDGLSKSDTAAAQRRHGADGDSEKADLNDPLTNTTHGIDRESFYVCDPIPGYVKELFSVSEYIKSTALETISEQQETEVGVPDQDFNVPGTVTKMMDGQTLQNHTDKVDGHEIPSVESSYEAQGTDSNLDAHSIDLPSLEDVASAQQVDSASFIEIMGDANGTETAMVDAEIATGSGTDMACDKPVDVSKFHIVTESKSAEDISGSCSEKERTDSDDNAAVECQEKIETATLDSNVPCTVADDTKNVEVTYTIGDIDVNDAVSDVADVGVSGVTSNVANVVDETSTVPDDTDVIPDVTETVTDAAAVTEVEQDVTEHTVTDIYDDVTKISDNVQVSENVTEGSDAVTSVCRKFADVSDDVAEVSEDVAEVSNVVEVNEVIRVTEVSDTTTAISDEDSKVSDDVTSNVANVVDDTGNMPDVTDVIPDVTETVTDVAGNIADVTNDVAEITDTVADVPDAGVDVGDGAAEVCDTNIPSDATDAAAVTEVGQDVTEHTVTDINDDVTEAGIEANVSDNVVVDLTFNITDGVVPSISFGVACTTDDVPTGVPNDVAAGSYEAIADVANEVNVGETTTDSPADDVDHITDDDAVIPPAHTSSLITDDATVDDNPSVDVGSILSAIRDDVNEQSDQISPNGNRDPITVAQDTETVVAVATDPVVVEGISSDVQLADGDIETGITESIVPESNKSSNDIVSDDAIIIDTVTEVSDHAVTTAPDDVATQVSDDVTKVTVCDDVTEVSEDVTKVSICDDINEVNDEVVQVSNNVTEMCDATSTVCDEDSKVSDDVTEVIDDVSEKPTADDSSADVTMSKDSTDKEYSQTDDAGSSDPVQLIDTITGNEVTDNREAGSPPGLSDTSQTESDIDTEKLLENLGKADRTTDDLFEENVSNFKKQEAAATKLQKEVINYLKCVKAMSVASNSFYAAIKETYEDDWIGYTEVLNAVEALSMLWEDYLTTLSEQVQAPLHAYIARFPEVKNKVSKRNRKLTDFDSCRHSLATCQNAKKQDVSKLQKSQEELNESKRIYEELNNELHEELPALYDNRINFLASNFNAFFTSEAKFQEESAKCKTQIANCAERLADESSQQMFGKADSIRGGRVMAADRQPSEEGSEHSGNLSTFYNVELPNDIDENNPKSDRRTTPREAEPDELMNHKANGHDEEEDDMVVKQSPKSARDSPPEPDYEPVTIGGQVEEGPVVSSSSPYDIPDSRGDDIYKVPINNQPIEDKLPRGVLYQVQATHPYAGEDTDELSFEAGEIINVVPFDDPDDQDEGWLMGMRDGKSDRGVFPANFTKRI